MNGDLSMTVTVRVDAFPTLVTDPQAGVAGRSITGHLPSVQGRSVQEQGGTGKQETVGRGSKGKKGRVS